MRDKSKYGWNTVNEYKRHDLADNLDDEKRIYYPSQMSVDKGFFSARSTNPLVLVRGSFWSRDNIFVALQFAKH